MSEIGYHPNFDKYVEMIVAHPNYKGLYYDRDKMFLNACYDKGYSKGKQERNREIAKEMLNKGMKLKDIIDITGLTEKEIKEIA